MRDVELITNKFLSKEFVEDVLKKNGWSFWSEKYGNYEELHVANKKGKYVFYFYPNKLDDKGNEIYDEDNDVEYIEETKKNPRFKGFKPYYCMISYFSDTYDYAVDFLYMLKKEGITIFFLFCGFGEFEELKNQL